MTDIAIATLNYGRSCNNKKVKNLPKIHINISGLRESVGKWNNNNYNGIADEGGVMNTETRRAEEARAKPAIFAASVHLWAKSWREQVNLAAEGSTPKALLMPWAGRKWRLLRPALVGCMKVAAACNDDVAMIMWWFLGWNRRCNSIFCMGM